MKSIMEVLGLNQILKTMIRLMQDLLRALIYTCGICGYGEIINFKVHLVCFCVFSLHNSLHSMLLIVLDQLFILVIPCCLTVVLALMVNLDYVVWCLEV